MKRYKAVLFDLDGTLLDTSEGIYKAIRYTEAQMDFTPLPENVLPDFVGPPSFKSYQEHYTLDEKTTQKAVAFHRHYQMAQGYREAKPFDGIEALLAMLKSIGIKLGVCTLKRQDITESTLSAFHLDNYFDVIVGIDMAESLTKAAIIGRALEALELSPEDAVLVGDSAYDGEGANLSGVDFIGVDYGFGFKHLSEIEAFHPVCIAPFVDDLIAFFDRIDSE